MAVQTDYFFSRYNTKKYLSIPKIVFTKHAQICASLGILFTLCKICNLALKNCNAAKERRFARVTCCPNDCCLSRILSFCVCRSSFCRDNNQNCGDYGVFTRFASKQTWWSDIFKNEPTVFYFLLGYCIDNG